MAVATLTHAKMEMGSTSSSSPFPCSSSSCCWPGQQLPPPASGQQTRRITALKSMKSVIGTSVSVRLSQRTPGGFPGACAVCRRGQETSIGNIPSPAAAAAASSSSLGGEGVFYSGINQLYRSVHALDSREDGMGQRKSIRCLASDIRPLTRIQASVRIAESSSSSSSPSELLDVSLDSEVGISYEALRDRLAAGEWEEADNETRRLLCVLAGDGAVKRKWVYFSEVKFFPVKDLQTIDNLWTAYSGGRYGFSVQRRIWKAVNQRWKPFFRKISWTVGQNHSFRKFPQDFLWNNDAESTPNGHLPLTNALRGTQLLEALLSHPAFEKADESSRLMDESQLVEQVFADNGGIPSTDAALLSSTTPPSSEKTLKDLNLPPELRNVDYSF
ncbi:hypothetical protein CBR_g10809 [Chara braunii]|uniref:GUN4-like domain-containing protein n=1 Tax=Chara braunii TaxID=69332 RepID=A0A388KPK4_CHABU|nr:hypothetical protein CBR_g10809 [Chara braunii]|eukprot:GBG71873.1 hypothetical protein CBR_g10809 [Chara braunii]